jgi:hypothetical protein
LTIASLGFHDLQEFVNKNCFEVHQDNLEDDGWSLINEETYSLVKKVSEIGIPLGVVVDENINYGIKTGFNEAFIISESDRDQLIKIDKKSKELIKPFLKGRDIKKYKIPEISNYLIFIKNGWTKYQSNNSRDPWEWFMEQYPGIAGHLKKFETQCKKRWDKGEYWWELRPCAYYDAFEESKLIVPDISNRGNFLYDPEGSYYCVNTAYIIFCPDRHLVGILNSRLITFFYENISSKYRGGYLRFIYQYLEKIPIYRFDFQNKKDKSRHDQMVAYVDTMLELNKKLPTLKTEQEKTVIQRQINATDRKIDKLVYELYDLTDAEIAIVEENGK